MFSVIPLELFSFETGCEMKFATKFRIYISLGSIKGRRDPLSFGGSRIYVYTLKGLVNINRSIPNIQRWVNSKSPSKNKRRFYTSRTPSLFYFNTDITVFEVIPTPLKAKTETFTPHALMSTNANRLYFIPFYSFSGNGSGSTTTTSASDDTKPSRKTP